jgi:transcriptional regulator with GAF, ATPase, and Fis domain
VAEAIGRSLYIPFDAKKEDFRIDFLNAKKKVVRIDFLKAFTPVNLSALSPSLIESELFGHVEGAFTGAVRDRIGRLEDCPEHGAVFLDEIGELTAELQVKLLRVLQTRRFQRVGENEDKPFLGKIIAATNRDLAGELQARRFREDFYYRLCADQIETPSLRVQLNDRPEDLPLLVGFICRAVLGEEKAAELAPKVAGWIEQHLRDYAWPGNFRELEQCVRSYTIRKEYHPLRSAQPPADDGSRPLPGDPMGEACETLATAVLNVKAACADEIELKKKRVFDQIKRRLFTLVRARTLTKQEAATLLGIDVRTLDAGMRATDSFPAAG